MGIQALIANTTEIDISQLIFDKRNALSSHVSLNKPQSLQELSNLLISSINSNNSIEHSNSNFKPSSVQDLFNILTSSIRNNRLSYFNNAVSDALKIPTISMSHKVVHDCLDFNSQLSTPIISTDTLQKAFDCLPKNKPNSNKSRYWNASEISDRLSTFDKLFSSFNCTKLTLLKSSSPNVFLLRPS